VLALAFVYYRRYRERTRAHRELQRVHRELEATQQELVRAARTDPLTGLANRRGLSEKIHDEVLRFRRSARPFSFVLCDIDDFKQINDRHGHERGDEVLVRVAQIFRALLREQDHAARWGGEEFLLLLCETDEAGARITAERLRQGIAAVGSAPGDPTLPVHMTFGVSGYTDALGVEGSIQAADEALCRGKAQGKNRVVAASAG